MATQPCKNTKRHHTAAVADELALTRVFTLDFSFMLHITLFVTAVAFATYSCSKRVRFECAVFVFVFLDPALKTVCRDAYLLKVCNLLTGVRWTNKEGSHVCFQGVIWILAQQAASLSECVCVCDRQRETETETAFLEMPFHWSKHHSNIVPPMTREQPVVLTEQCEAESYMGWGQRSGRRWGGGKVWGLFWPEAPNSNWDSTTRTTCCVDPWNALSVSAVGEVSAFLGLGHEFGACLYFLQFQNCRNFFNPCTNNYCSLYMYLSKFYYVWKKSPNSRKTRRVMHSGAVFFPAEFHA